MNCTTCGEPSRVIETDVAKATRKPWCLDHAPKMFARDVARMRAMDAWTAEQEVWLADRAPRGETVPSWRVLASRAFEAGMRFADADRLEREKAK